MCKSHQKLNRLFVLNSFFFFSRYGGGPYPHWASLGQHMPGVAPELQRRPLVLLAVRHGHDVNECLHRGGGHQGLLHRILPVGTVAVSPTSRAPYAQ